MNENDKQDWTVWGTSREPLHIGSEEECKQFVEKATPNDDLYIMDAHGDEFILEGGKWMDVR